MLVSCRRLFSNCFQIIVPYTQISWVLSSLFWLPGFSQDAVQNLHAWYLCTNRSCFFFLSLFLPMKVNTFCMLHGRGRNSYTPTMIQCTENQLKEDYTHGWIHYIHMHFCLTDKKWWYSVTSCVISKCGIKISLFNSF